MSGIGKKLSNTHHWNNRVVTRVVYNSKFQNEQLFDSRVVNNLKMLHGKSQALYSDVVRCSNVNGKTCKKFQLPYVNRKFEKIKCIQKTRGLSDSVKKSDRGKHRFTSGVVATEQRPLVKSNETCHSRVQKKHYVPFKEHSTLKKSKQVLSVQNRFQVLNSLQEKQDTVSRHEVVVRDHTSVAVSKNRNKAKKDSKRTVQSISAW